MSTLSSLAAAEQAQLRLFLSQSQSQSINQLNNPLCNQFFKPAFEENHTATLKVSDYGKKHTESIFETEYFDPPQYSVTSDFYQPAPAPSQPYDAQTKPFKQSSKRNYEETGAEFEVNKRSHSIADDLSEAFGYWPESGAGPAEHVFQSFENASHNPSLNNAFDFDFNVSEIGVMDLSRLNSLGDQLLLNQSNNQLQNMTGDVMSNQRAISGDVPELVDPQSPDQSYLPQLQFNAPLFVGSPNSTLSQKSNTPEYTHRSIESVHGQTMEPLKAIDRSVSQTSSVQSLPPPMLGFNQSVAQPAIPVMSHTINHQMYQSPHSQALNQLSHQLNSQPKGEGHRRMKRRLTDKQRRAKIKDGLEHLRSLVHLHGDSSTDQASVVQSSINLIKQLVQESTNRKQELAKLKEEGVSMAIQLQAQVQAAQQLQTLQQRRPPMPIQPVQRESSGSSDTSSSHQAPNPASLAQSLMTLLNQTNQANNNTAGPTGSMDSSMLSSYLLQTIQILSQLPMSRLPQ